MYYYKIYHYSSVSDLKFIDPSHYGSGVTKGAECKYGKTGLEKSYFYTKDKPEDCVRSQSNRYEIYLPYDWKEKIYDLGTDDSLYLEAQKQLEQEKKSNPYSNYVYPYEINERTERLIKEKGYKGWTNSLSPLPYVIVLFYKLPTGKPIDLKIAYDWLDNPIEIKEESFSESYKSFHLVDYRRSEPFSTAGKTIEFFDGEQCEQPVGKVILQRHTNY